MTQMGMDVEAVESIGRQLKQSAASVESLIGSIDKTVGSLLPMWDGPDAQRFVQQAWPQHRKYLVAAQSSVDGLGQSALNNVSEQREASGAPGSGGGGAPGLPQAIPLPHPDPVQSQGDSLAASRAAAFQKWLPVNGTEFRIGSPTIQCVGLVNDYALKLFPGVNWSRSVGHALSASGMYAAADPNYFDKIPAGQPPQPGDIVVVGANQHSYAGHVAVVGTVNGNLPAMVVEQSGGDPDAHPPIPARATFTGQLSAPEDRAIIGYLRPKPGW
jgi:uncharacterized protein YukE